MIDPTNHRGIAYLALAWSLTFIATTLCAIRLYSRTILTRSVGSDDFAIVFALALSIAGSVGDIFAVEAGYGAHKSSVPDKSILQFQKWNIINSIMAFITFCFIRASVMLFVLRLLPVYKRWQKYIILVAFALNIAITLIGTISFGVSCIPFRAWYQDIPGAKCFTTSNLVITNQVNAGLSCVIDIATAAIPQLLLWKVQMKPATKRSLNVIFGLGLVTSALSIARAATINNKVLTDDSTYRILVFGTCGLVEAEMGIICACAPAIRQFVAYVKRTGTVLPTKDRQYPNQDFVKMRRRINLRDIFWYQSPHLITGRVLEALPVGTQRSKDDVESTAQRSLLGDWRRNLSGKLFNSNRSHSSSRKFDSKGSGSKAIPGGTTLSQEQIFNIGKKYKGWRLLRDDKSSGSSDTKPPFLNDDSQMSSAGRDYELADTLADPSRTRGSDVRRPSIPTAWAETDASAVGGLSRPEPAVRTQQSREWPSAGRRP